MPSAPIAVVSCVSCHRVFPEAILDAVDPAVADAVGRRVRCGPDPSDSVPAHPTSAANAAATNVTNTARKGFVMTVPREWLMWTFAPAPIIPAGCRDIATRAYRRIPPIGDRTEARGRDNWHTWPAAAGVARLRRSPARASPRKLVVRHVELDQQPVRVDRDRVAFLDQRDRPANEGFGCHVTDDHAQVPPEKRPSVISPTDSPSPWPISAEVGASISCIPGPPFGPS